ncbi:MAG TPA: tetratricopeptide repeat protein [Chthoniobacterales bacterium]|jgi:TolB-like protein/Flp pilus assembly protein TadD|nr:tetratricopeptide repeat protein [Chthoniobacterales bacterium]
MAEAADARVNPKLEIAHVLTMDIVEYSKLLITEQSKIMAQLTRLVRETARFRRAEVAGKLLRLPTGDGMVLVFFDDPEAPVECASEISAAIKNHPDIPLRMGIHSGPVNQVIDVNDRFNIAGAGIDIAQRVMDCGDAGHILLSKRVADDLVPLPQWNPCLHELGECEVKHGRKVSLVNFYTNEIGNPNLPRKCSATKEKESVRSTSSAFSLSPSKRALMVGTGLFVVALAVAAFIFSRTKTFQSWKSADAAQAGSHSIAVMPFENAGNDPNTEYLAEGISEALINSLAELRQLRVIARATAFRYKRKDVDPQRVGRELQVAAVLTGKVRQMQDALNVQVDLVDAATGAQIWGAGYDRKLTDLVAIKQAIAQEVTAKLKLKLSSEEQRRLVKRDSSNAEAYQFYLRGRYFWNKRTPDGIKQAIDQFQQAIQRDPNFALGYTGLADSYIALTFYNFAAPHETMPKAKESALKAVALDDTAAEPQASLGNILVNYDWNWSAAEKAFKRSIELKPDYATGHEWYAIHYLTATGRLEEAVQEMKKALELEPASLIMNTFMGATLYYAGRYDEAVDQCRRTIEMDPNFAVAHWHLGLAYEQKQVFDAAIEEFQKAVSLSGGSPLMKAALGHAYAKSQKKDEANKILGELNELSKQEYVSSYEVATIYVALGDNEQAFQLLEKAYAEHSFHLVRLNVSPHFKAISSDPRFQDLVHSVGLSR